MTKTEAIKYDLLQGLKINMLKNIKRYGTSCRSRIAEFRAMGMDIEDFKPDGEQYKIYYMTKKAIKAWNKKELGNV